MEKCSCSETKHTPRSKDEIDNINLRLRKICGQIKGIEQMVEDNKYCKDILIQVAAAKKALENVGFIILENHLKTCVSDDIKNDNFSSLEDALEIVKKLK